MAGRRALQTAAETRSKYLTGGIGAPRLGQKQNGLGDLLWHASLAQYVSSHLGIPALRIGAARQWRVGHSWIQAIDCHAIFAQRQSQALGQSDHATLGGSVVRIVD